MWAPGREGCIKLHQEASHLETLKRELLKPSRECRLLLQHQRGKPGEAVKEKAWFNHIVKKSFTRSLERKKGKMTLSSILSFQAEGKHGLVMSSGNEEKKVCSRLSFSFPLWPWASLLTSLCLFTCKLGISIYTHCIGI